MQFVYDNGLGALWGCADDAASLAFFLSKAERIEKIIVYKMDSVAYHVEVRRPYHYSCDIVMLIS